ncbi:Actin-binding protein IPP [Eumeta japonica]|uniref:Actin-binding protein IPP n=1 Tax=Eumeta variegata TaxID=151549 RepID=A0A4C1WY80_EUMVA|nr:Actin-binding protein IPP [Eumeta japonica]
MNYKINNYAKATFENFQKFRQDGNYCDVDIISGNTVVKLLHKNESTGQLGHVPSNRIDDNQKGAIPGEYDEWVELPIELFLGKIYISSSNAQLLMSAAHFLLLENLVNCCSQYLKTQLHPSNAIGIFRFAEAHNCTNLAQFAWDYIQVHWFSFAEMEEFLDLPFQLLMKLLSSDKLLTEDEDEVLHVALHWLKHDLPLRRQHCIEVLQRVHIHQLKPQAFEDALKNIKDPYIAKILNMLREKRAKDLPTALPPSRRRPRNLYVVGGLTRDVNQDITLNTILRYDACNRFWEKLAPMQSPRVSHGVVAVGGKLYAVGGSDGLETLSSGEVYDIAIGKWSHIAPMKKARKWFGLAALNRKLYAFGGLVDGRMDSTIEVYDPVSNVWSLIGDMPEPRWATKAITYEVLPVRRGGEGGEKPIVGPGILMCPTRMD